MGFFDIVGGRVEYFNNTAVPVHNDIGKRIRLLDDKESSLLIAWCLDIVASPIVDYFFKTGKLLSVVKNYKTQDFKNLYKLLVLWPVAELISMGVSRKDMEKVIQQVFDDKTNLSLFEHNPGQDIERLYEEIGKILQINTSNPGGYLAFHANYARIMKEALRELAAISP